MASQQQFINVYDRPTYETEKVKGFDRVRMFKGSATTSPSDNPNDDQLIPIISGQYVFNALINTYQKNYKGTNFIANSSTLEDFDSFIIKSNGVAYCSEDTFSFRFDLLDSSNNPINNARVNPYYSQPTPTAPGPTGGLDWFDWYIEVELTFFREGGDNYLVVNGNLTYARKSNYQDIVIIPICGTMEAGTEPSFYIDFAPIYTVSGLNQRIGLKSVSLEFIE